MRSRNIIALSAAMTMLVPLSGAFAKTVTLTMTSWGSTAEMAVMAKLCQQFEKANPGIKVKYYPTEWGGDYDYLEKIVVATAAGKAPDVLMVPYLSYPCLAEAGVIADITSYLTKEKRLLDDWTTTAMEATKWKGRYYGLPSTTDAFWTIFNERTFQEVGLPAPDRMWEAGTWTLENMVLAGQKIQRTSAGNAKKLDRVGIIQMGNWEWILPWVWSAGGDLLTDDGTKSALTQRKTIEGFQYFVDAFINKGAGAIAWDAPYFNSPLDFTKDNAKLGMCIWLQSLAGHIRTQKVPWTVNMVPLPLGGSTKNISVATVHEFSISKASKNKDAAWKLIKFLSGPEGSSVLQKECLWFQSSKRTYDEYANIMLKFGASGIKYLNQGLDRMRPATRTTAFDKVMPLIDQKLSLAYAKRIAPETALQDAEKAIKPQLDRKFRKK